MLGTFGLVMFISFRINRLQPSTPLVLFIVYAGALGLVFSTIFLQYIAASITRVFFISGATLPHSRSRNDSVCSSTAWRRRKRDPLEALELTQARSPSHAPLLSARKSMT